jgi:type IV pilus assembly protein PilW
MRKMNKNQKGLTLIEMMIAMVIGLLVVGTVITIFITNVRSNRDNVSMIRLNQELRGVMTFISDEVKRAGYSTDSGVNDFIEEFDISTNCIRYGYDDPSVGTYGVLDASERFGFRAVDTAADADSDIDTIEWGRSNTDNTCDNGTWNPITEYDLAEITNFTVADTSVLAISGTINIPQVTVSITGQTTLSGGTIASRTISEVIRLRNDEEI